MRFSDNALSGTVAPTGGGVTDMPNQDASKVLGLHATVREKRFNHVAPRGEPNLSRRDRDVASRAAATLGGAVRGRQLRRAAVARLIGRIIKLERTVPCLIVAKGCAQRNHGGECRRQQHCRRG